MPFATSLFDALSLAELEALKLSFKVALLSASITLPIALGLAYVLARRQFWFKGALDALIHLPMVLPPVVVGYLLLITFSHQSPVGQWLLSTFGLSFAFNWWGAALASGLVALPLMVRALRSGYEGLDPQLGEAASTLGFSPLKVFLKVTLPLLIPSVISAWFLGFARALGEFGATITFVSNIPSQTQTLPLAMFQFIETPGAEWAALRLCILAVLLAFTTLLLSQWLHQRALQKIGKKPLSGNAL